ncbi:MAG: FHA domain-containing protein, partial [Nannocystaceae bacterium]
MEDRTQTVTVHQGPEDDTPRCLRIISGYESAGPVVLGSEPLVIGREEGTGLRLQAEGVSRRHAKISCGEGGQYTIIDLGSKNGTF